EEGLAIRGAISCTQPRRVAAVSVPKRIAAEVGRRFALEVGCPIRFEGCTSPESTMRYTTDIVLLREFHVDSKLSKYLIG
ncbi:hypothetical protein BDK51DRAFT_21534, partial [Blyttiomyces helicus]